MTPPPFRELLSVTATSEGVVTPLAVAVARR
jgi:hypothetical protein